MNLYQNLRAQRLNKGLTQEEVANYLNLSRQTISKWEQGKSTPSIEDLTRLCGLYETTLDQITQAKIDDDNKPPKKRIKDKLNLLLIGTILTYFIIPVGGIVAIILLIFNNRASDYPYKKVTEVLSIISIILSVIYAFVLFCF